MTTPEPERQGIRPTSGGVPAAEPVTLTPPRRVAAPSMVHDWTDVAFVHWAVDPQVVRPLLPRHVRPDTLAGETFVGLIGLRIRVTVAGLLPLPWLGAFDEIHLRAYSVDREGRRGGVFLALNADRLATSMFARTVLRIPYTWSPTTILRTGAVHTYTTSRRWPAGPTRLAFAVRVGDACPDPTALERFVTARWSMHSAWLGNTLRVDAEHPPWPLFRAELMSLQLDEAFFGEVGLPPPRGEPVSVLWSPGVRTELGWPVPV